MIWSNHPALFVFFVGFLFLNCIMFLFLGIKTKIEVDFPREVLSFKCIENMLRIIKHFQLLPAE